MHAMKGLNNLETAKVIKSFSWIWGKHLEHLLCNWTLSINSWKSVDFANKPDCKLNNFDYNCIIKKYIILLINVDVY